ncbi:MAG: hypothetical protein SFT92_02035 [Rickettsiales bacterium]|nr:hypothetical protein [Rickettsiales bacterium]
MTDKRDSTLPSGHQATDGKGQTNAGGCPFKHLFSSANESVASAPNAPFVEQSLQNISRYNRFMEYMLDPNGDFGQGVDHTVIAAYNFKNYRQTRSFATSLIEKRPPNPGIEQMLHVMHTQFRLMASRIGGMLDTEALVPESGHGIDTNIAAQIATYASLSQQLEQIVMDAYEEAEKARKEKLTQGIIIKERSPDNRLINLDWLKDCLGGERKGAISEQINSKSAQLYEQFRTITELLSELQEVPIKTAKGTRWIANDLMDKSNLASQMWYLGLSSDSQIDPLKVGQSGPYDTESVRYKLVSIVGGAGQVMNYSIVPLIDTLHQHAHREVEAILASAEKAMGKAVTDQKTTVASLLAAQDIHSKGYGDHRKHWLQLRSMHPEFETIILTPKEMVQLLKASTSQVPRALKPTITSIIKSISVLPPNDSTLLAKTLQAHPEWQEKLDHLNEKTEISKQLFGFLTDPKSVERSGSMEAAR